MYLVHYLVVQLMGKKLSQSIFGTRFTKKYDYKTFTILECSKQNISSDLFFNIFVKAHESLNNKRALTYQCHKIQFKLELRYKV